MSTAEAPGDIQLDELGPIDYVVIEWPGRGQPDGAAAPVLIDLVDRGIIRILDVAMIAKAQDGSISGFEVDELDNEFREFAGASTGVLGDDDLEEAAKALEPGTAAAILVWENRWAAPVAMAVRRSGGQLVASGRIPVQAVLAALDAIESKSTD